MTSLLVMVTGCILCLSLFQFSIIYGQINESFNAITPSVIHQSLQFSIIKDQWTVYLDPVSTSVHITDFFKSQLSIPFEDYQLAYLYFHPDQITLCFSMCYGVEISLTSIVYLQTFHRKVHYQLYAA
jgi:hypothetical protein